MALGVEVDLFYARRGDAAFRNFQQPLLRGLRRREGGLAQHARASRPSSTRTCSASSAVGAPKQPAWSLINHFQPKLDMLAISTFPGAAFKNYRRHAC